MAFTHFRPPYAFMGWQVPMKEAKAVVMQVPYDGTTSYRAGTREGPHAIICASRQVEFYDSRSGKDCAEEIKIHTLPEMEPDMGSPENTVNRVEELCSEVLEKKKFPILFGGEHSLSAGMARALSKKHGDLSVLQIDAHADLRDSFEGTKASHASVMRRIRENAGTVVQAGIRSMCSEEAEYIGKEGIGDYIHHGNDFIAKEITEQLTDNVYVTIDLDGFDPSECPGVGTPEPGGITWQQGIGLLEMVSKKRNIVGFDVMELMPVPGSAQSEFFAAKLAYKALCCAFRK